MLKLILFLPLLISIHPSEAKRFFITSSDACSDCDYQRYSYKWCRLGPGRSDWDYCSTSGELSCRDEKCSTECDFYGENYLWCYLEKGGWDYCSRVEDHSTTYATIYNMECQNYCDMETNGKYECITSDLINELCSLVDEVTATGDPCKYLLPVNRDEGNPLKNSCGNHGYNYQWCRTSSSWNYCSSPLNKTEPFLSTGPVAVSRKKRAVTSCRLTTIQTTRASRLEGNTLITYVAYENQDESNRLRPIGEQSRENRIDAFNIITDWHRKRLESDLFVRNARISTLIQGDTIRFDRERSFDRGGVTFANVQLQINGWNVPHPSTVAHVNIEIGPAGGRIRGLEGMDNEAFRRHVVTGLSSSLKHGTTAWVWQELVDSRGRRIPR